MQEHQRLVGSFSSQNWKIPLNDRSVLLMGILRSGSYLVSVGAAKHRYPLPFWSSLFPSGMALRSLQTFLGAPKMPKLPLVLRKSNVF
ncbi:hypothetical protein GDO81_002850 [Engystomops pustulosus]|uniref:Uncharacterized protein n=1 Tax=Engystomops pustulosus TaxID=76066 RepID=A0AAV7DN89_ENGPU|nr:hypothetical protein GDO81_002850 [Engystomops pustulosus]